jgi:ABC-2 type transport system permease protein
MTGFGVLVRKELLEQWRTMRLGVVAIVYLAFGILSPVLAKYTPEIVGALLPVQQAQAMHLPSPTTADAIAQFTKNIGGNLMLAPILLAMTMIAVEKERGTAAFVLTKAAARGAFVAAKIAALGATLAVAFVLSGVAAYAYTAWFFPAPDVVGFVEMIVLVWLSQLALGAVTLLGSALVRGTIAAGGFGIGALAVFTILSVLPTIGPYTPLGLQGIGASLALGKSPPEVLGPVLVAIAIVAAATVAAWAVFRRQEL